MKDIKLPRVALIFGGRGYEKEVSVLGADNLFGLIDGRKYDKIPIYIDSAGRFLMPISECAMPSEIARSEIPVREVYPALLGGVSGFAFSGGFMQTDAVFPLLHGNFGEDGVVQGALECAGISFVGCDTLGSAAARDKMLLKSIAGSLSIPTAKAILCRVGEIDSAICECEMTLSYPVFVKPTRLGSSIGAARANDQSELREALLRATALDGRAMIEEYIEIEKELECAYFCAGGEEIFTHPGEILTDGFYDYDKKYGGLNESRASADAVQLVSPCAYGVDGDLIIDYSRRLARTLSLRDISRIDFLLSKDGRIYFNEINTMPGFTAASLYLRLVERAGIPPAEAVSRLIDAALSRRA
ncbi:MAG: D-alanine--D-alanine ligase [Ruminococcaceae bacterium]|nr:D-alanine--D-alanine ligase [Oscillospiraceae bacterium]